VAQTRAQRKVQAQAQTQMQKHSQLQARAQAQAQAQMQKHSQLQARAQVQPKVQPQPQLQVRVRARVRVRVPWLGHRRKAPPDRPSGPWPKMAATHDTPGTAAAAVVVLYHYPCPDGAVAAWAAHLGLPHGLLAGRPGRDCPLYPFVPSKRHGGPGPNVARGSADGGTPSGRHG
jgi:hypothetical protein